MTTSGTEPTKEEVRANGNDAERSTNGEPVSGEKTAADTTVPEKKKHPLTWERTIEIAKLLATVWVALVGSYVTMQFNERQHELNRIEAIAKMLPHISSKDSSPASDDDDSDGSTAVVASTGNAHQKASKADGLGKKNSPDVQAAVAILKQPTTAPAILGEHDMSRDGAIWAIFRTANNRVMLRDLAALFPEDIYRVVGSIAIAGELEHDKDALVALQVASEKLAAKYSADPKHAELASRLYAQALRLKERKPEDETPLHVIDLTTDVIEASTSDEHIAHLVRSVNDLADLHFKESTAAGKKGNAGHWQAKDLYKRARQIGANSKDMQTQMQVVRADLGLARIYLTEHVLGDALQYVKEAHRLAHDITPKLDQKDLLKALDTDGNGFATQVEIIEFVDAVQAELAQLEKENPVRGVSLN